MRAILEIQVDLFEIHVVAEVAFWERHPELQPVCATIAEATGWNLEFLSKKIPGLSPRQWQNLQRHMSYLRLTNERDRLTPFGKRCAESGEAPAWELGAFSFLVARHPALGTRHLGSRRLGSDGFDRAFDNMRDVPDWLQPDLAAIHESAFDPNQRYSIGDFPAPARAIPQCRMRDLAPATLTLDFDPENGENHWTLKGDVNGETLGPLRGQIPPGQLAGAIGGWDPRWDPALGRALVSFDGKIRPDGTDAFTRTYAYKGVELGTLGRFDKVEVEGVPIGPRTDADAQEWTGALTLARVQANGCYVTPKEWSDAWAASALGTPLQGRCGPAPEPSSLREAGKRPIAPRVRWLLSAASDIGMEV